MRACVRVCVRVLISAASSGYMVAAWSKAAPVSIPHGKDVWRPTTTTTMSMKCQAGDQASDTLQLATLAGV